MHGGNDPQVWRLEHDDVDEEFAIRVVLDSVRSRATRAVVDARGTGSPPADVAAAQAQLMRVRAGHDVELDPVDDAQWELVRAWAPWSLRVALDTHGRWLASVDDCGGDVRALLDSDDVSALAADGITLVQVGAPMKKWWKR